MLLLIDNFDSFTYNLVQLCQSVGVEVEVVRNNARTVEDCLALSPQQIIIGPGPGRPINAGISCPLIEAAAGKIPILGICLGHQCIGEVYGAHTVRAQKPMHGKISNVHHHDQGVFVGLPKIIECTRYHSLVLDQSTIRPPLEVTATTDSGEVMAIRHQKLPIEGLQFHPEAILSTFGTELFYNFFDI